MASLINNRYATHISSFIIGGGFFIILIIGTCGYIKSNNALDDAVIIVASIKKIEYIKNSTDVYVQYFYNGKLINSEFSTYHPDSLKVNLKIRLLVSKKYPAKYIRYIGLGE